MTKKSVTWGVCPLLTECAGAETLTRVDPTGSEWTESWSSVSLASLGGTEKFVDFLRGRKRNFMNRGLTSVYLNTTNSKYT